MAAWTENVVRQSSQGDKSHGKRKNTASLGNNRMLKRELRRHDSHDMRKPKEWYSGGAGAWKMVSIEGVVRQRSQVDKSHGKWKDTGRQGDNRTMTIGIQ
jgi:hypothetical protein